MGMDQVAVSLGAISKCYRIFEKPRDRLKQALFPRLGKLFGRGASGSYFREFWSLRDVSLEIRRGETVGIIGRNGSGKSTLLQILCGTLAPTTGSVRIAGRVGALLELGSGFNPEFTGRENVYLNAAVLGMSRDQIEARLDDILAFAEIGDFIDQPVKSYSSGMYVRLAFAVIAHIDADVLVIDEALSVGDVYFGQKCMRFLRKFMERGTVIFVSHDTAAVLNLCDRAVWLDGGRVVADGPAREVTARYLEALNYDAEPGVAVMQEPAQEQTLAMAEDFRDMRADLFDRSTLRNDIEVFAFSREGHAFGEGGAQILDAALLDVDGRPLAWLVGGSEVRLRIRCRARRALASPIVGFEVYDRLGQTIFADNTYIAMRDHAFHVVAGEMFETLFEFRMPVMREGDYTISVAIAEGTQQSHVQHHWMHEALAFHVHSSSVCLGLVGVPMRDITMRRVSGAIWPERVDEH